jgi:DNA-binding NarL/FixJ family response regulator
MLDKRVTGALHLAHPTRHPDRSDWVLLPWLLSDASRIDVTLHQVLLSWVRAARHFPTGSPSSRHGRRVQLASVGSHSHAQGAEVSSRQALSAGIVDALISGRDVLLVGESGCGKSFAAAQATDTLTVRGHVVWRIAASPADTPVPLAALSRLVGGATGGDLVGAALATLGESGAKSGCVTVVVVDDAHFLDEASAVVVHQLGASGRVRLLLTVAAGARRPAPIERLAAAATTQRFDLGPIDSDEAHVMLAEMLGGSVETSAVAQLVERSERNPLYLRELVRGSMAAGSLSRHGIVWRLVAEVRPSPRLRELLMVRLAPMASAAIDALEMLAVAGRIELDLAGQLIDRDVLESLEQADLIAVRSEAGRLSIDLAHATFRDLLNESIGALRRMRIFRLLAHQRSGPAGSDAEELQSVVWHVRGGVDIASERLTRAARIAMEANDTPLGVELAQAAARSSGDVEAVLIGCWCLSQLGRHDEAIADADHALLSVTDPWERAALHQRVAEEQWWFRHDLIEARRHLGVRNGLPPGPWTDLLRAQQGVFAILDGEVDLAIERAAPLVDHDHGGVRFVASLAQALALSHTDAPDQAIACATAAFQACIVDTAHQRLTGEPGIHLISQLIGMIYAGRYAEAAATAEFVHQAALNLPGPQPRGWAATVRGFAMLFGGEPAAATVWFTEAEAHWIDAALPGLARWVTAGLVLAESAGGAPERARASLDRLDEYDGSGFGLYAPIEALARVWVATEAGSQRDALQAADEAIDLAIQSGATALLALVGHDLARLDLRLPAKRALGELEQCTSAVIVARRQFTAARIDDDPAGLVAAAEMWEALGAPLFAAESMSVAADLFKRAGQTRERNRCEGHAGLLLGRTGAAHTPPLANRLTDGPLSTRETQVALLAAGGLSSREIAAQLVIGDRTVESHLYRIFVKLGITSRDDIAAALERSR